MENPSRKLTVTYFDPDASDSSSDEISETTQKNSKRKVHEVILPKEKILKNNKNLAKNEAFSPKCSFVGVRHRPSGKYSSEIKDPFTKKKVYLGTFTTPEEASRAFLARKLEIQRKLRAKQGISLISREKSNSSDQKSPTSGEKTQKNSKRKVHEVILPKEKILKNNKNLAKNEAFSPKCSFVGVRHRPSGKYSSEIKDPFTKKKVYLGIFTTPEEASRAFLARKLEIQRKLRAKQGINLISHEKSNSSDQKSPTSVLEIETSDLSNFVENNEERFGFRCGVQIVDENGFFVGDFGKIDDLSICTVGDGVFLPGYEFWGKWIRR